jgi:hypothetical protein
LRLMTSSNLPNPRPSLLHLRERPRRSRAANQRDELAPSIKKTIGHDAIPRDSAAGNRNVIAVPSSKVGGRAGT